MERRGEVKQRGERGKRSGGGATQSCKSQEEKKRTCRWRNKSGDLQERLGTSVIEHKAGMKAKLRDGR